MAAQTDGSPLLCRYLRTVTARLVALGIENFALHHDSAHFGVQIFDGGNAALDLLAEQQLLAALAGGRRGGKAQLDLTNIVVLLQHMLQRGTGRIGHMAAGLYIGLQRALLPVQAAAGDLGIVQQNT